MGQSKRRTPILPIASSKGQHLFKKQESRAHRRAIRQYLQDGNYNNMPPHPKEYGNEWASPRDGRQYCINPDPKWMRK